MYYPTAVVKFQFGKICICNFAINLQSFFFFNLVNLKPVPVNCPHPQSRATFLLFVDLTALDTSCMFFLHLSSLTGLPY